MAKVWSYAGSVYSHRSEESLGMYHVNMWYRVISVIRDIVNFNVITVEPPKTDSPHYGNLHNADKKLQSRIIPYSILYIVTSV